MIDALYSGVTFFTRWNSFKGVVSALIGHRNARDVLNDPWLLCRRQTWTQALMARPCSPLL
jgi:hypothetical protein